MMRVQQMTQFGFLKQLLESLKVLSTCSYLNLFVLSLCFCIRERVGAREQAKQANERAREREQESERASEREHHISV